jgi:hypothetical protein
MNYTNNVTNRNRGQALVESLLLIPAFSVAIVAVVWFSRLVITRQQLLSGARYGTDLILYTDLSENEIRQELRNYLAHKWIKGRKLDTQNLSDKNIFVKIDSFELPNFTIADYFFPLAFAQKLEKPLRALLLPLEHTSYVEINYKFKTPGIVSMFGKPSILISARSEVIAKTGCPGRNHQSLPHGSDYMKGGEE